MPANYPTLPSVLSKMQRFSRCRKACCTSPEDFENWRKEAAETLRNCLGLQWMEECIPEGTILERVDTGEMIREHLLIQTESDVQMSAYLLIPYSAGKNTPVFLCPHGHNGYGKETVAGLRTRPEYREKTEKYHYDYGYRLARLGYVVLCPDCRGQGERREEEASVGALSCDCTRLAHMGLGLGISAAGMMVWDLMQAVTYLRRRGEWNGERILGCGFSGGGMQMLYLMALDPRMHAAMLSGYFYGFTDALVRLNDNCSCNYVPGVMRYFDMCDIAAMACPRRLVIQSGTRDHLAGESGLRNVTGQVEETRAAYAMMGAGSRVKTDFQEGDHSFYPQRLPELAAWLAE